MQLKLQWQVNTQPHTYTITNDEPVLIGRKKYCDIVLSERTVSRQHAEIFIKDGMFYMSNLSQANPIYIYTEQTLAQGEVIPLQTGYVAYPYQSNAGHLFKHAQLAPTDGD